jgi:hypothetical protein
MTCIVGLLDKGTIYMGADSAGTNENFEQTIRRDEKVFIKGDFIFGCTTSFRMLQLIRYAFTPPARKEGQDAFEYMVTDFMDGLRSCLKTGGFTTVNNGVETGGFFLVGHKGRLFRIECDFQVGENTLPYDADGCGRGYALGSMFATEVLAPTERITKALQAAETFNAGVRGPFNILKL